MATSVQADPRRQLPLSSAEHAPGWWGMVCLIVTEAALFVYFLFSYFYLASMAPRWPPNHGPELTLSAPNTVILLASSATMWWAERGIRRGEQTRLRVGLLITCLLGIIFLGIQLVEYHQTKFLPSSHAYGSLFYTITGFHFGHVLVGVLMNLTAQLRAWRGHFGARHHLAVTTTGLYWHFVDAVWLCVFFSLYITPRFWWHP